MFAFFCTGPPVAFDPICDGSDLVLLFLAATGLALACALGTNWLMLGQANWLRRLTNVVVFVVSWLAAFPAVGWLAVAVFN